MRVAIVGLLGLVFLGSWSVADDFSAAFAADKGLMVRAATLEPFGDDRNGKIAIETVNPATGETESIWTGLAPTNEVLVSPDSTSISFIEPVRYVDGKMEYESTLRVIGFDGIERHTVPGVRRHRWSPDSRSIVYLTGPYAENGQGFKSAGTFIYDLASKESKQIAPWGYDATWAAFDGAIYIWYSGAEGKDVLRYDPATGALTDTPYRDIFFSPDGLYYYRPSREGTGFELRLTATNEIVVARWPFLAIRDELIYPRGWIDDTTLVIPASHSRSPSDYVFNLNEGVPRQANGEVIGYTADKKSVYVLTEGGITSQPLAQMTVVPVHGSNLSVLPQSDDGAPFAYRILGDVELVSPPRRVEFSDSGNHLMVQFPRHDSFLAVYTDAEKDAIYSKKLPGANAAWVGADTLVVGIPESPANVALPSYTRIAVWEDEARSVRTGNMGNGSNREHR